MKKNIVALLFVISCPLESLSLPQQRTTKAILQNNNPVLQKPTSSQAAHSLAKLETDLQETEAAQSEPLKLKNQNSDGVETSSNEELIEFHFENAELGSFISQIEAIFDITFISDDMIEPLVKGGKGLKGHKINFRTQKPFTRQEAWNLFITFMQMLGFSVTKHTVNGVYRISTMQNALKMNIPAFIGTRFEDLPETDELIRYVYFVENSSLETIKVMIDSWRSSASSLIILQEQKAFVLTDRAHNVKILMEIIKELDRSTEPQVVSLLKLKQADAKNVKELYDKITKSDEQNPAAKLLQKKQPTSLYFPENLRMIAEPRNNALILLGPKDSIKRVEEWITKHIDTSPSQPYAAYYTYQLKYADAVTLSEKFNNITQFGRNTEAGKYGGVRGQDKYIKPMVFIPEPETNKLIIKGDFEGYLAVLEHIQELDAPPKQVALDMLILSISTDEKKELGSQLRSKSDQSGLLNNIAFQTSGLLGSGIMENKTADATFGVQRLLGNLLEIVQGAGAGNTILSLGSDTLGVWGLFRALQTVAKTEVIADPFLTVSNKTPGMFSTGEARRVQTSTIFTNGNPSQSGTGQDEAKLEVKVTPQINSDGMIVLDLDITFDSYLDAITTSANKTTRKIKTTATAANNEVIALGGLVSTQIIESMSKFPVLGDIPLLGWIFGKNKQKQIKKDNLLILICPRLIDPISEQYVQEITVDKMNQYETTLSSIYTASTGKDPISKAFFGNNELANKAESFMFGHKSHLAGSKRGRVSRKKMIALSTAQPAPTGYIPHKSIGEVKTEKLFMQNIQSDNTLKKGHPETQDQG